MYNVSKSITDEKKKNLMELIDRAGRTERRKKTVGVVTRNFSLWRGNVKEKYSQFYFAIWVAVDMESIIEP